MNTKKGQRHKGTKRGNRQEAIVNIEKVHGYKGTERKASSARSAKRQASSVKRQA